MRIGKVFLLLSSFLSATPPTGNKAMQAGYNTKILKELLSHWHDHLDHLEPSNMTFMPFFFFFGIQFIVREGRNLMVDLTYMYNTPLAPNAIFALTPKVALSPSQGAPRVLIPQAGPTRKRRSRAHLIRTARWCIVTWCLMCCTDLLLTFRTYPAGFTAGTMLVEMVAGG